MKIDRTFRRIALHTVRYALMIIPAVSFTVVGVVWGIIQLYANFGFMYGSLGLIGIVAIALMLGFSYLLGKDYVEVLERKEEEVMRQLQREARY